MDWERKGGPELIEAFVQVRKRIPSATLTIAGCSPRVNTPGCTVLGPVPPSASGSFFEQASVFCLPTRHDPCGFVLAEALAYGLPIVATRVGALPDMVTDGVNGFLVPPRDASAVADALSSVLADEETADGWAGPAKQ